MNRKQRRKISISRRKQRRMAIKRHQGGVNHQASISVCGISGIISMAAASALAAIASAKKGNNQHKAYHKMSSTSAKSIGEYINGENGVASA